MFEVFQPLRMFSAANGQDFLEFVNRCIKSDIFTIVVDLKNVNFMDSAGLAALVTGLKRLRNNEGRLALCSLNGQARMLLEMTNMDTAFDIYTNLEEAKQSLSDPISQE